MPKNRDRNFDSLITRFEQAIYETKKGDWRLRLLKEDLNSLYESCETLAVWDAGCGFAQMSCWLAEKGHRLTLCDISEQMLARARLQFSQAGLVADFFHEPAQALACRLPCFDLVLLHAVLEWLGDPMEALRMIADKVNPGGHLSLMFYNRNAMVYTNALKGGWRWKHLLDNSYLGKGKKLTPPNPQYPHEVVAQLEAWGFTIVNHTGIRVFHDYLRKDVLEQSDGDELVELENRYSRMPTYRDMGRYVHLLARRASGTNLSDLT
jgi:S-adenosylmethionine-dependent methyltransferase